MTKKLLVAAFATLLSANVFAEDISYTYVSAGLSQAEIDLGIPGAGTFDLDDDGFNFGLSVALTDNVYTKFDTVLTSGSLQDVKLDLDFTTVNFGYNMGITDGIDFIAELGFAQVRSKARSSFDAASAKDDGANLVVGVRGLVDSFEWAASAQHFNLDDSTTFFNVEGRYLFTDAFSVGLKAAVESDVTIYSLTARFDF